MALSAARGFGGKVASVATGTALGAAVAGLSSLLLTRLYEPEDFGLLALAMAVTSLSVAAAAGKLDAALPLERTVDGSSQTAYAAALLSLSAALVTVAVLVLVGTQVDRLAHVGQMTLFLLPPIVVLAGLAQTGFGLALRTESFSIVGIGRALGPSAAAIVQIALGFLWPTGTALVVGQLVALALVGAILWLHARAGLARGHVRGIVAALRRHWRMPAFVATSNLLTMAGLHAPLVLLGSYFSMSAAGVYAVTYRVLTAPALLLGQSIGQVFYARIAAQPDRGQQRGQVEQTAGTLFDLSTIVFAWIFVIAPWAFAVAFGEQWKDSGSYARLLVPWLAASFIASPLSQYALVRGKQGAILKISLLETAARALSLAAGLAADSAERLVLLFGLSGAVISSAYLVWILSLAQVRWRPWLWQRLPSAVVGAAVVCLSATEGTGWSAVRLAAVTSLAAASVWLLAARAGRLRHRVALR